MPAIKKTVKIFVRQITVVNGNIRYQIIRTLNLYPSSDLRIGHILTEAEIRNMMEVIGREVEIT